MSSLDKAGGVVNGVDLWLDKPTVDSIHPRWEVGPPMTGAQYYKSMNVSAAVITVHNSYSLGLDGIQIIAKIQVTDKCRDYTC